MSDDEPPALEEVPEEVLPIEETPRAASTAASAKAKPAAKPRAKRKPRTVIVAEPALEEPPAEAPEAPPELEPLPPSEPPAPEPLPPIPKPKRPPRKPKAPPPTPAPAQPAYPQPQLTPDVLYPLLADFLQAQRTSSREAKRAMYRSWLNT